MNKKEIYDFIKSKKIWHEIVEHKAVFNMQEVSETKVPYPEYDAKNLFVRDDKKKNYYLITVRGNKRVDLKNFKKKNNTRNLSFASEDDLMSIMNLMPGAVTPLGLLNDKEHKVQFYIDKDFMKGKSIIGVHPNDNTATIWLKVEDLINIIKENGNTQYSTVEEYLFETKYKGIKIGDKVKYNEGIGYSSNVNSNGYLNIINNLNIICNDLYSNGLGAVSARSLNVRDINKLGNYKINDAEMKIVKYRYSEESKKIQFSSDGGKNWTDTANTTFKAPGKTQINEKKPGEQEVETYNYYSCNISKNINMFTKDGISIADLISQGLNKENNGLSGVNKDQWIASKGTWTGIAWTAFIVCSVNNGSVAHNDIWRSHITFYYS